MWLSGDTTSGCGKHLSNVDWSDPKYSRFSPAEGQEGKQTVPSALTPAETQGRTRTHHSAASLNLMAWHPNSAHCKCTFSVSLSSGPLLFCLSGTFLSYPFTTLVSFDKEEF